jgi:hypothetical protein
MNSLWRVHIRIEKNGKFGEYNDTISALGSGDATAADLEAEVKGMIINRSPQLKGGRITRCEIRKVS